MRFEFILWSCLAAALLGAGGCRSVPPDLLPAEGRSQTVRPKGPPADNSRCHVCHLNYEEEPLAVQHAQAGIGCVQCHGQSDDHAGDEDNITPPDIMFPAARINPACLECHPSAGLSADHKPILTGADPKHRFCLDCHGEHRLQRRTVRWDKTTGALLPKEKPGSSAR